jgi:hypothetical protein
MRIMTKILGGAAGIAALGAAAPAAAQWGYSPYANPYASPYAYSPYAANVTTVATQQCAAAVQARLNNRVSLQSILGAALGVNTAPQGRVVSFTQVTPRSNRVTVRGLATSGRMAGYGPYGVGAYGALGYGYQPDLSFRCTVDYAGRVRDVDINRRF